MDSREVFRNVVPHQADLDEEVVFRPRQRRVTPVSEFESNDSALWMAPHHGQATEKKPSKENSRADWDGTFLSIPLGYDWELRDGYDTSSDR